MIQSSARGMSTTSQYLVVAAAGRWQGLSQYLGQPRGPRVLCAAVDPIAHRHGLPEARNGERVALECLARDPL